MATVYRPLEFKPLPDGAELFTRQGEQYARWKDPRGKTRTARVRITRNGTPRIVRRRATYVAQYRDGRGLLKTVPTGCRDEDAARSVLNELVRRAELVKGKVLTHSEARTADHQAHPLVEHFDAYDEHLTIHVNRKTGFRVTAKHRRTLRDHLNRVATRFGLDDSGEPGPSKAGTLAARPGRRRHVSTDTQQLCGELVGVL
jgi:hypothetical protein